MLFDPPNPADLAISDFSNERTWQELEERCLQLANFLNLEQGLSPGDHIAVLVGNRIEVIEIMLAGILAGVWITPINTHLTAAEIAYIYRDSGAGFIFYDKAHAQLLSDTVKQQGLDVDILDQVLADSSADLSQPVNPLAPAGGTMLYTSGTTGHPKGVKRARASSIDAALETMRSGGRNFGLCGRGPHLITGPLYHAAPMLLAIYDMLNGASLYIMPKWDNAFFIDAVREKRIVTTHLVPTMFVRLLNYYHDNILVSVDNPDEWNQGLSSLQYVLHGAAPISRATKEQMINWWGPILFEYWGATEAGITTLVNSEDWLRHPGTVGKPLSNFEVYIGDEQGNRINAREGMLFCRHRQLAQVFEYHNDPEKTRKAHPQPHVFYTGDIGYLDDEGFVYLSDRESNMIISGGVNIYPLEIENCLLQHPAVEDVGVFGIPNEEWGEEVKAAIQLKPAYTASNELAENIINFARAEIARYKVPRSIDFHAQLPRTPTGKLLVRKLKQAYNPATAVKT